MIIIVFLLFDLLQHGQSAIHFAAMYGQVNVLKHLLINGADPNLETGQVMKLFKFKCYNSKKHPKLGPLLAVHIPFKHHSQMNTASQFR